MLQKLFDLLYALFQARTDRLGSPEAFREAKQAVLDFPWESGDELFGNTELDPSVWTVDANDKGEAMRDVRDLLMLQVSHRTVISTSLLAPCLNDKYLTRWKGILQYKYPYTEVEG